MKPFPRLITRTFLFSILLSSYCLTAMARGGGGGGHSSHSSSSGHSSGGSFSGGGFSGGGGGSFSFLVFIVIVIFIIYLIKRNANKNGSNNSNNGRNQLSDGINDVIGGGILGNILGTVASLTNSNNGGAPVGSKNFPEGLTSQKITTAFMEIQAAWQQQDLSKVRKWISDGVYQRFTAQFEMMKKLTQRNYLSNIRIYDISVADTYTDGVYECSDIAITFSMDDKFICEKYPSLNESYYGDTDTEYWTFIKRKDAKAPPTTDLYSNNNCPNCGASLENKLGEVSRCSSCGTLTNNAAYDWILSEITQDQDYEGRQSSLLSDAQLQELVKNDPLFSVQRMEDIASNVFMQIMEVLSGDNNKRLSRFADKETADKILEIKEKNGLFVFDRLYLNDVTLSSYDTNNGNLNLHFDLGASFKRVQINGNNVRWIDRDFVDAHFQMVLSKKLSALQIPPKEIAFSYECANCGAPYDDTTNDTCTYCGASVVDLAQNWVLINFTIQ